MNAFDDDRLIASNLRQALAVFLMSHDKIEGWQIHLFACKQIIHVAVEQMNVHRVQILVVLFAVGVHRSFLPFQKIVIRSHIQRLQSVDTQLNT